VFYIYIYMTRRLSRLLCSVEEAPLLESRLFIYPLTVNGGDTASCVTATVARVCLTRARLDGGRCQGHTYYYYYYYYKLLLQIINGRGKP